MITAIGVVQVTASPMTMPPKGVGKQPCVSCLAEASKSNNQYITRVRLLFFGRSMEEASNLRVGDVLEVIGDVSAQTSESKKDGKTYANLVIAVMRHSIVLSGPPVAVVAGNASAGSQATTAGTEPKDDDIPF